MRNWFILFTTTFTITTLVLSLTTWLLPDMHIFDSKYVILLVISSALISFFMGLINQYSIENLMLNFLLDISLIFIIVYSTGIVIRLIPFDIAYFILTLLLVIIIYIIITLIYLFILKKEAEVMNKRLKEWRNRRVDN